MQATPQEFYSLLRFGASNGRPYIHIDDASHDTLQGALSEAQVWHDSYPDDSLVGIIKTDAWGNTVTVMNTVQLSDWLRANDTAPMVCHTDFDGRERSTAWG